MQKIVIRREVIVGLLSLGLLTGMALMASPAQADSPGPYYATPSWDQTLPAATRFIVLSNFASLAVLDRETGLVWEKAPTSPPTTWIGATDVCISKAVGGRKGWRLPSVPELMSLVDPSVAFPGPTLPAGHPFTNVLPVAYWSATTIGDSPSFAWPVNFANGGISYGLKTNVYQVWCVRGGMNADTY